MEGIDCELAIVNRLGSNDEERGHFSQGCENRGKILDLVERVFEIL
jgi:hypothetical protein